MSLERRGFVGLFKEPLGRQRIGELVLLWIERFGRVEQTIGGGSQVLAQAVHSVKDVVWEEKDLQFRVIAGEQFTWIYITQDHYVIETSGLVPEQGSFLCRDVLMDLCDCKEIIDENNDRRLDELEARGLM